MTKLGVTYTGKNYSAAVYSPSSKGVRLRLYKKGAAEAFSVIDMKKDPLHRNIYTCDFGPDAEEYDLEDENGTFTDPYALQLAGDEVFGSEGRTLRACLFKKPVKVNEPLRKSYDYSDLIIYKLHVRGFTKHPSSGVEAKEAGTFRGITRKIRYIKSLGINAVLLMPCYDFNEIMPHGSKQETRINYWGYGAKASYFAPKTSYSADPAEVRSEFASMVRELHANDIDVLMEMDFGSGIPDVMMSGILRFWHEEYHIDGFRLMGAYVPARLFATDPYLKGVRLIGSYWGDNCSEAFKSGGTPDLAECNEDYMVTVRRFLKGDEGCIRDFADRLRTNGDRTARVNYIADHDGFTLADLYSYDVRHNEANKESNQDGREINYSWNCGVEGPTGKKSILKLRRRMMRNALTVLFLSQGTPMLMAGDEFGCTHGGNNNPYCCDNEQGWLVWEKGGSASQLLKFTRELIALRKGHRVFSNRIGLRGTDYIYNGCPDISYHGTRAWYPDYSYFTRMIGMLLNGAYALVDRQQPDDSFYVVFNMHWEEHEFDLPTVKKGSFEPVLGTDSEFTYDGGRTCLVGPRSIAVFKLV